MTNTKKVSGYIVYEGVSQLDGISPIVGIVTLKSANDKTGNMAQLWILRSDMHPSIAKKTASDGAICGGCIFRQSLGGACYVTIHQAPAAVYRTYVKGNYPQLEDFSILEGRSIRFGAYGDIAALPLSVAIKLKAAARNNTSYTHQWKKAENDNLKQVSMASVDNLEEAELAKRMGWRWFRVTKDITDLRKDEIICPNTTKNIQCKDCGLCSGNSVKAKSIVIEVHGSQSRKFKGEDVLSLA